MTIAHRGLKVKVNVMCQANAVGSTSIERSFSSLTAINGGSDENFGDTQETRKL